MLTKFQGNGDFFFLFSINQTYYPGYTYSFKLKRNPIKHFWFTVVLMRGKEESVAVKVEWLLFFKFHGKLIIVITLFSFFHIVIFPMCYSFAYYWNVIEVEKPRLPLLFLSICFVRLQVKFRIYAEGKLYLWEEMLQLWTMSEGGVIGHFLKAPIRTQSLLSKWEGRPLYLWLYLSIYKWAGPDQTLIMYCCFSIIDFTIAIAFVIFW